MHHLSISSHCSTAQLLNWMLKGAQRKMLFLLSPELNLQALLKWLQDGTVRTSIVFWVSCIYIIYSILHIYATYAKWWSTSLKKVECRDLDLFIQPKGPWMEPWTTVNPVVQNHQCQLGLNKNIEVYTLSAQRFFWQENQHLWVFGPAALPNFKKSQGVFGWLVDSSNGA